MSSPTNKQLQEQIQKVDEKSERRHRYILETLTNFRKEINDQLQPFHDYIQQQIGAEEAMSKVSKSGSINLDPKIADIIKWLILIIGTIVGAKLV